MRPSSRILGMLWATLGSIPMSGQTASPVNLGGLYANALSRP